MTCRSLNLFAAPWLSAAPVEFYFRQVLKHLQGRLSETEYSAYIPIYLFILSALFIGISLPLKHSPDGSTYYGVTLLLIQGRFADSVAGLFSPLISWLMVPVVLVGFSIPSAFRIINLLAFVFLLIGTRALCNELRLRRAEACFTLGLIGLQTLYATFALITSDLLVGCIGTWCWYFLLKKNGNFPRYCLVGLLAALGYYAKAVFLPLFLVVLLVLLAYKLFSPKRSFFGEIGKSVVIAVVCIGICLPWILVLSSKYGEPIISAQQLKRKYNPEIHTFSPRIPPEIYFKRHLEKKLVSSDESTQASKIVVSQFLPGLRGLINVRAMKHSLVYLSETSSGLFFGQFSYALFVLTVACFALFLLYFPYKEQQLFSCVLIALVYFVLHLIIWGPYIRYYYPVLPLFDLLSVKGLFAFRDGFLEKTKSFELLSPGRATWLLNLFIGIIFLQIISVNLGTIKRDWHNSDQEVADYASNLPLIKNRRGVITGNFPSFYPPYIAYSLKREFWDAIVPSRNESPAVLERRLQEWEVSQILWFAEPYENLDRIDRLVRHGPFRVNDTSFYVYNWQGAK